MHIIALYILLRTTYIAFLSTVCRVSVCLSPLFVPNVQLILIRACYSLAVAAFPKLCPSYYYYIAITAALRKPNSSTLSLVYLLCRKNVYIQRERENS